MKNDRFCAFHSGTYFLGLKKRGVLVLEGVLILGEITIQNLLQKYFRSINERMNNLSISQCKI